MPNGRIAPRFILWRDGRLLPVMKTSGGPSSDSFSLGAKPFHVTKRPYDFEVYVGTSRTPRHLYLDFEIEGMPRWYVKLEPTVGNIPSLCEEPLVDIEKEEPPTPRAAHQKKSLAGKCGIPFARGRIYVEPLHDKHRAIGGFSFPDGGKLRTYGQPFCGEYGREFFGNVRRHYRFAFDDNRREWAEDWEEDYKWFVRADFRRRSED